MKHPMINIVRLALLGIMLVLPLESQAQQPYPSKPVRIVTGLPGLPHEVMARMIQPRLAEYLGQPIIVESKAAGPSGVIIASEVAKAAPDGHTLLSAADTLSVAHHLLKQVPYDGLKAFAPVKMLVTTPMVLAVHPSIAVKNLSEFLAYAKSNPGKIRLGTIVLGSKPHIVSAMLAGEAGVEFTHVPFKSGAPLALVAGDIDAVISTPTTVIQLARAGKIRLLAVTSKTRFRQLPDVPTVSELIPGFEGIGWFGIVAPAQTPKDIVARLHREITRALAPADVREKIAAMGFDVDATTSDEFGAFMQAESDKIAKVIRQYNITAD